jgi:hypothetical protein
MASAGEYPRSVTHDNWRAPASLLRAQMAGATKEQLDLARHLKLTTITKQTPALLAAGLLRDALGQMIGQPPREPSSEQLEYLNDLDFYACDTESPSTHATASASLKLREIKQALDALEAIKPAAGDIVEFTSRYMHRGQRDPHSRRLIKSIGDDGTVYFQGGGGQRSVPHRIQIVYRADDDSTAAQKARLQAEAEAKMRATGYRDSQALSIAKMNLLARWEVPERPITVRDVDVFRGVIDAARDERPVQLYLQDQPYLLTEILTGGHGRWLRAQTRFGSRYVADFLIADADSTGIRWRLIELESPSVRPFTAEGEWRREARHAQHQIKSWRHYLRENLDSARKNPEDEGLGLVDIEAGSPALILISRRSLVSGDLAWMRRELALDSGIEMHTYDWLLERLERKSGSHSLQGW